MYCTSGELKARGVQTWLSGQPDYGLLMDLATNGANLMYDGLPQPGQFRNRVPPEHEEEVDAQIRAEVARGWLVPLPATVPVDVPNAPLQTCQEPTKVRRITDYSNVLGGVKLGVNGHVRLDKLGDAPMQRSLDLARAVRRMRGAVQHDDSCPVSRVNRQTGDAVMLVRDVSKAFRRIGVRRADVPSLHFRWKGVSYLDTRLPFGHAASAHYCCKLTAAIAAALTEKFHGEAIALAYVDDFVIVSKPHYALQAEAMFLRCLTDIGLPISDTKAQEAGSWSPVATWIGFVHDAGKLTHALPPHKRDNIHRLARAILMARHEGRPCTVSGLRTLCGKLSHVATVYTVGRAFLRELQAALQSADTMEVLLPPPAVHELEWWLEAIDSLPSTAAMRRAPCPHCDWAMVSDASLQGQGAVLFRGVGLAKQAKVQHAHEAFAGRFSSVHPSGDMTLLEAWALLTALKLWKHKLAGTAVWAVVDNESLRWAITKGRSKSPRVNSIIRAIMMLCLRYDIQLFPDRVQTDDNVLADELSRWEPRERQQPEWTLALPRFHQLEDQAPHPLLSKYDSRAACRAGPLMPGVSPSHGTLTRTRQCSTISNASWRPAAKVSARFPLLLPQICSWPLQATSEQCRR